MSEQLPKDSLFYRLTGGRPMKHLGFAFTDVISGKPVSYWRDKFGREWMAVGAWSLFRVRRLHSGSSTPWEFY